MVAGWSRRLWNSSSSKSRSVGASDATLADWAARFFALRFAALLMTVETAVVASSPSSLAPPGATSTKRGSFDRSTPTTAWRS